MGPEQRHCWRLLEDLPARLARVERWTCLDEPADDDGHLHTVPSLVACLAGAVRALGPDGACDLGPGEALVIAPGVWHEHVPVRPGTVFFAQGFLPTGSDVILGDHRQRFRGLLPREPSHRLCAAACAATAPAARLALVRDLLAQVLAEQVEDLGPADPAFRLMVRRLWSSLHRGVAVADLVRASGRSRAQAYRLFTAGYGLPPKAALEAARLELAEALAAAGLPAAGIARRCGFASARSLARAGRRRDARTSPT